MKMLSLDLSNWVEQLKKEVDHLTFLNTDLQKDQVILSNLYDKGIIDWNG